MKFIPFLLICFIVFPNFPLKAQEKRADLNTGMNAAYMSNFERDYLYEINLLRSDPKNYLTKRFAYDMDYAMKKVKKGEKDMSYSTQTTNGKKDTVWFDRNQRKIERFEKLKSEFDKLETLPPFPVDSIFFKATSLHAVIESSDKDTLGYHINKTVADSYSTAPWSAFYPSVLIDHLYPDYFTPTFNVELLDLFFTKDPKLAFAIHETEDHENENLKEFPFHFFACSGFKIKTANLLFKKVIDGFDNDLGQFTAAVKGGNLVVGVKDVIKLGDDGKITWRTAAGIEISAYTLLVDESVIVGGVATVGKKKSLTLVKLDPTGKKVWEKNVVAKNGEILALAEDPKGRGFWVVISETFSKKEMPQTLRSFDPMGSETGKYAMSIFSEFLKSTQFSQDVTLIPDKEAGLFVFGVTRSNSFEGMLYKWGTTGVETQPTQYGLIEENVFDREYANFIVLRNPLGGFFTAYAYNSEEGMQEEYRVAGLDEELTLTWSKDLGGDLADGVSSMVMDADGNLYLAGFSYSGISGEKSEPAFEKDHCDVWVIKVSSKGNKIWDKTITGPGCILSARLFHSGDKTGVVFREETHNMIALIEEQ